MILQNPCRRIDSRILNILSPWNIYQICFCVKDFIRIVRLHLAAASMTGLKVIINDAQVPYSTVVEEPMDILPLPTTKTTLDTKFNINMRYNERSYNVGQIYFVDLMLHFLENCSII